MRLETAPTGLGTPKLTPMVRFPNRTEHCEKITELFFLSSFSLCPIPPHFVKFGNATSFFRIGIICVVAQTFRLCYKFGESTLNAPVAFIGATSVQKR